MMQDENERATWLRLPGDAASLYQATKRLMQPTESTKQAANYHKSRQDKAAKRRSKKKKPGRPWYDHFASR